MSTRRRPITSPPGGGSCIPPVRASMGPASRIEARMRAAAPASSCVAPTLAARTRTSLGPVHSVSAPRTSSRFISVSTSLMRGTFSRNTSSSVRSVAASMGSAAFLLPLGRMVPLMRLPPWTMNLGTRPSPTLIRESREHASVSAPCGGGCASGGLVPGAGARVVRGTGRADPWPAAAARSGRSAARMAPKRRAAACLTPFPRAA